MRNHQGTRARNLSAATLWCEAGFWDSTGAICLVLWRGSRLEFLSTVVGGRPELVSQVGCSHARPLLCGSDDWFGILLGSWLIRNGCGQRVWRFSVARTEKQRSKEGILSFGPIVWSLDEKGCKESVWLAAACAALCLRQVASFFCHVLALSACDQHDLTVALPHPISPRPRPCITADGSGQLSSLLTRVLALLRQRHHV